MLSAKLAQIGVEAGSQCASLRSSQCTTPGPIQSDPNLALLQDLPVPKKQRMFGLICPRHADSFLLWSADGVYECHWSATAHCIFRDLLDRHQDALCQKLFQLVLPRPELNVRQLFQDAADYAFDQQVFVSLRFRMFTLRSFAGL